MVRYRSLWSLVGIQVFVSLALLFGFVVQNAVIYPLEVELRQSPTVDQFSYLYLPHGLKVLASMVLGVAALPAILAIQTASGISLGMDAWTAFRGSVLAVAGLGAMIGMSNYLLKQALFRAPIAPNTHTSTFRILVFAVLFGAAMNGMFQAAFVPDLPISAMNYFVGDLLGAAAVCSIGYWSLRRYMFSIWGAK